MTPLVYIILVNWNGWTDTVECIASLSGLQYNNYKVLVVDNCSSDDSVLEICAQCPSVEVIRLEMNMGFAGGNNVGIRHALSNGAEYIWLLNNDTTVSDESLSRLVSLAVENPSYLFYGSWITYYKFKNKIWYGGGTYNGLTGGIGSLHSGESVEALEGCSLTSEVAWVTGCSILVSKKTIEYCGYMDDSFFLYREELEWQLRKNLFSPKALIVNIPLVFHKVGVATGSTNSYLGTVFMSRNFLKIALKHKVLALPWFLRWCIDYILKPVLKGRFNVTAAALRSLSYINTPGDEIVSKLFKKAK